MNRSSHPLYQTWKSMRHRCNSPKNKNYQYYGARGIGICARWDDFWNFVADMGERPDGYSLDRINPDGDYCAENCRWASNSTQNRNKGGINKGFFLRADGKYQALINVGSNQISLGNHDCAWAAYEAYWDFRNAFYPNTITK